jgi:hypothetical protein
MLKLGWKAPATKSAYLRFLPGDTLEPSLQPLIHQAAELASLPKALLAERWGRNP